MKVNNEIEKWCISLCGQLEKIVFPFFQEISTPMQLVNAVEKDRHLIGPFFSCPAIHISRLKLFSYLYTEDFEKLSLIIKKYPTVYFTGHSLGGNLATHTTIAMAQEGRNEGLWENIKGCVNFDGPGFSEAYLIEHDEKIKTFF